MIRPPLLATVSLAGALALSACDRSNEGASVSINADGGNVLGAINGETGEMKIDVPGFQGSVKLPKIKIDTGNFDLNGVRLYPGSSIKTLNIAMEAMGRLWLPVEKDWRPDGVHATMSIQVA